MPLLSLAQNRQRNARKAAPQGQQVQTQLAAHNILIVEDDPIVGMLLVDLLLGMGHLVCALKTTRASAVHAARLYLPSLLLVDVGLGPDSGIAAVAEIQRTCKVPYIYMTGALIPVGGPADIVLYKPFLEADLAFAISGVSAMH